MCKRMLNFCCYLPSDRSSFLHVDIIFSSSKNIKMYSKSVIKWRFLKLRAHHRIAIRNVTFTGLIPSPWLWLLLYKDSLSVSQWVNWALVRLSYCGCWRSRFFHTQRRRRRTAGNFAHYTHKDASVIWQTVFVYIVEQSALHCTTFNSSQEHTRRRRQRQELKTKLLCNCWKIGVIEH